MDKIKGIDYQIEGIDCPKCNKRDAFKIIYGTSPKYKKGFTKIGRIVEEGKVTEIDRTRRKHNGKGNMIKLLECENRGCEYRVRLRNNTIQKMRIETDKRRRRGRGR